MAAATASPGTHRGCSARATPSNWSISRLVRGHCGSSCSAAGRWFSLLTRCSWPASPARRGQPTRSCRFPRCSPGMRCTGLSVIQGTEISVVQRRVVDVIAAEPGLSGAAASCPGVRPGGGRHRHRPRLLRARRSICDGRNAGAISEGLGEYGNEVALATPIEDMIRDRPPQRHGRRAQTPALLRAARPLAGPLTVTGLSAHARPSSSGPRARRRPHRRCPCRRGPLGGYQPPALRPAPPWRRDLHRRPRARRRGHGHLPRRRRRLGLRASARRAGRRSLFLQDAYVFA